MHTLAPDDQYKVGVALHLAHNNAHGFVNAFRLLQRTSLNECGSTYTDNDAQSQ